MLSFTYAPYCSNVNKHIYLYSRVSKVQTLVAIKLPTKNVIIVNHKTSVKVSLLTSGTFTHLHIEFNSFIKTFIDLSKGFLAYAYEKNKCDFLC